MRAGIPQISFADVEFLRQGVHLDPLLEKINRAARAVREPDSPFPDSDAHQELGLPRTA